jgi:hypothetical protein
MFSDGTVGNGAMETAIIQAWIYMHKNFDIGGEHLTQGHFKLVNFIVHPIKVPIARKG